MDKTEQAIHRLSGIIHDQCRRAIVIHKAENCGIEESLRRVGLLAYQITDLLAEELDHDLTYKLVER